MIEINHNPSRKQLLQFAGIWFPLFCALVGFLLYRKVGIEPAAGLWIGGGVLAVVSLISSAVARYLYIGLVYLTYPIGWVVSHVILALLYYLLVTPIGFALRVFGRDPLRKTLDPSLATYWQEREPTPENERYFRQY